MKLSIGFFACGVAFLFMMFVAKWQFFDAKEATEDLLENDVPGLVSSEAVTAGLNHSLAALRGFILLKNDDFKSQRKTAFTEQIYPSLTTLRMVAETWNHEGMLTTIKMMQQQLNKLDLIQENIEEVVSSKNNNKALALLIKEGMPLYTILLDQITSLIDRELTITGGHERKQILGHMANVRGSLAITLAQLQLYGDFGDQNFIDEYELLGSESVKYEKDRCQCRFA